MRRRPVCIVCLLLMAVLAVLNRFGICLLPEPPGNRIADRMISADSKVYVTVVGKVRSSEIKDEYSECVLTDAFLMEGSGEYGIEKQGSGSQKSGTYRIGDVRLTLQDLKIYPVGYILRARGQLAMVPKATNPGQFDSGLYYRIQKIRYRMKKASVKVLDKNADPFRETLARFRRSLKKRISEVFPSGEAGILSAMLIGDKSMIEEERRARWQAAGVVHMLAISGLHLTILGMGLYRLLKKIFVPESFAVFGSVSFLFLYSVFTGLSVSTLRAFLMFALLLSARLFGRTYDPLTSLSFAALLILLENPYYLFYSGFQLSFSAVFFCILFGRRTKLMMSLLLSLGMLPFILNSFYEIPLYSIPVNLIAVPLLPAILGTGILGTAAGGIFSYPAVFLLRFLDLLFRLTQRLPGSSIIVGKPSYFFLLIYYALFSVWAFYMKKYKAYKRKVLFLLLVPAMIFLLVMHPEKRLRLIFLDVGQGDSCLIETPHRSRILIDGGSSTVRNAGTYRILPALKAEGAGSVDYLILTHMDADHINGIEEILTDCAAGTTTLTIGTVVFPYLKDESETYQNMQKLARSAGTRILCVSEGDRIGVDGCELTFFNPDPAKETDPADENASCLVFHFQYRKFDTLFTGDVEGEGEENVLKELISRTNGTTSWEVLKVAHHGSSYSTPKKFLKAVRPAYSVISVGEGNRYGHPAPDLIKRLEDSGTKILRTDEDGAVAVDTDGKKFRVSTYR